MVINPTYLAQKTRTSINWHDAQRRVITAYRQWLRSVSIIWARFLDRGIVSLISSLRQAPEIQQMYSLNIPVSQVRTKVRQEFERHRYVNKLPVVDMLLFRSHSEFQVGHYIHESRMLHVEEHKGGTLKKTIVETMNFWKQISHVMKYFRETDNPTARLPENFMQGFLEGRN